MRYEPQGARNRPVAVHGGDELADAVDEDVAVEDSRKALGTWSYLGPTISVLVAPRLHVRLLRKRENRVLHGRTITLQCGIEDVADEEVRLMPDREQWGALLRDFSHCVLICRVITHHH